MDNTALLEITGSNCLQLNGSVSFDNAAQVRHTGKTILLQVITQSDQPHLSISLKHVTVVDSSVLSVLISWLRDARSRGTSLSFIDIPPQLEALASVSGVDSILNKRSD